MRRFSPTQVSTGDEGFTTSSSAQGSWMEDGSKGLDAAGNLACAAIDFATVHLCACCMQSFTVAPTVLCMSEPRVRGN